MKLADARPAGEPRRFAKGKFVDTPRRGDRRARRLRGARATPRRAIRNRPLRRPRRLARDASSARPPRAAPPCCARRTHDEACRLIDRHRAPPRRDARSPSRSRWSRRRSA
ncbi:MAG: hypothetical protein MZW92_80470 [Comamonadaceae bacterium]|nr:hypothetical protein [Comamonadaceae bacterium]